jgi:hypothetical protein
MCDDCFRNLIYKFDSQKQFEDFETVVQNKCISNKITIIRSEQIDSFASFYKCNSCGQIWTISIPENAWRGFFLTEDKGIDYTKKLKEKDRVRGIGCLVVVIVVTLVILLRLVL